MLQSVGFDISATIQHTTRCTNPNGIFRITFYAKNRKLTLAFFYKIMKLLLEHFIVAALPMMVLTVSRFSVTPSFKWGHSIPSIH